MKSSFKIFVVIFSCITTVHCNKKADDFKSYLDNHEIVYPGIPVKVIPAPGKNRVALYCVPSPDQSITRYVIYWNNKIDSIVFNVPPHATGDTLKFIIPKLNEYVYSFKLYTYDGKGNRSVPVDINSVRAYGAIYESRLLNRGYNATTPYIVNNDKSVQLNFITPDTINIATAIRYTDTAGIVKETFISGDSSSITLRDYKTGTQVTYRSSYIPVKNSIDTFYAARYDPFPPIYTYVECNKSLFAEVRLPNDVQTYSPQTSISKLWDGTTTPQSYPNIFHSDGSYLPHVLTFDMGKIYFYVSRMEETGRDCCNNPVKFEVWGIKDTANAVTTLRADNPGWKNEAIAKGWTLLKEVVRSDDGKAPFKVDLMANPPPVRYIRIRIITTATGSNYSNMSELTFWDRQ